MERKYKGPKNRKILNTISNFDQSDNYSRTSYKYHHNNAVLKTDNNREEDFDDNYSQNSNSVHTSYKYRKRKKGNMTISSRDSNYYHNQNNDFESSVSISINDNLICPDCINETLIEEKRIKNDLYNRDKNQNQNRNIYQNDNDNDNLNNNNNNYNNYTQNLIDKKRLQREQNTNYAKQTLSKFTSSLSSKERLIQINENSSDPFQENNRDYQYEKFRKEYDKRQKLINENLNKYFPVQKKKSLSETPLFFDKTEETPNNKNKKAISKNDITSRKEYIKSLEEQMKYKNEKKQREKEEDKIREKKYFEDMEQKMKKEENDKFIKEQKQKEKFIKDNMEIINQKNKDKMKELKEKIKYKEFLDKQNELYKNELLEKQKENEKLLNEIYSSNKKEKDEFKKIKEKDNNYININDDNNNQNNNEKNYCCYNLNAQKGECCRCHRILPRRLLTINRYFYKENRNIH